MAGLMHPASLLNPPKLNKCPFHSLFSATFFFHFFPWVIFLFKMDPEHSAKVLSSDPKLKKAVMCLTENICVREA